MKVRWGVIGACGIAKRRTVPEGIIPSDDAELVAIMDVDGEGVRALAEEYDVPWYTSWVELCSDENVDAVYIATPTHLHADAVIKAALFGKHVLVEKPMAMMVDAAELMVNACHIAEVRLGVGYMMRFHAHHLKLKEMIDQGQLGHLTMGRAQLTCWYPLIENAWRQNPKLGGGGALIDMGTHCIDVLEMMMGKVTDVTGFVESVVQDYLVEDSSVFVLRFENGALGFVDNCFNVPDAASSNMLEIYGTLGSVVATGTIGQSSGGQMLARLIPEAIDYDAGQARSGEVIEQEILVEEQNIYKAEIDAFSRCIIDGTEPPIPGEHGLRNLKLTLAAYKAAKTGQTVHVGEE